MDTKKLYKQHARLKKLFFKTRRKKEGMEFKMADITARMLGIMNAIKQKQEEALSGEKI